MNKIYCSSGVMVGRINNNNYKLITRYFPSLIDAGYINGVEFMFSNSFYDKLDDIYNEISYYGILFEVMHFDKEIGIMLSESSADIANKAMELLEINCKFAKRIGAKKGVFHLWGGIKSDSNIEFNISYIPKIICMFNKYDIELLIENIPCTNSSGLNIWKRLYSFLPQIGFIFDTRFGAFHDEINEIFDEPIWNHIKHIHISDYSSYPRNFSKIRPILHPSEGVIDFDELFKKLKKVNYTNSITLESPVFGEIEPDIEKLKNSLNYIKNQLNKSRI